MNSHNQEEQDLVIPRLHTEDLAMKLINPNFLLDLQTRTIKAFAMIVVQIFKETYYTLSYFLQKGKNQYR